MGEYQYYDFLAVDSPLGVDEMAHLRDISSRAEITPVSFVNEYNWGDLKADPQDLMRDFFDVHVYLSNSGSAVLMLRLPREVIDSETLEAFAEHLYFEVETLADYRLLTWSLVESEDYDRFEYIKETGWMTRLAPVREELLRGDLRSLYIGWLQAVTVEDMAEEREPMALHGLGNLTAAQRALAEFLEVDPDLLAGAGIDGRDRSAEEMDAAGRDAWLDTLPHEEVRGYLHQMLVGQGAQAERELMRRFAAWRSRSAVEDPTGICRTVAELWQKAEQAQKLRLAGEAEARSKAEAEEKKRREAWLILLAGDFATVWKRVHEEAERGCASAYDSACRHLVDLRDAYNLQGMPDAFHKEFQRFMSEHRRRKALVTRLQKAGFR